MADKYTININPQVSASDGQRMENELNSRFANVAKKFGTNLKNTLITSLKVGATAGLAGVVGMIATNPYEKTNEDKNRILNYADDIATRAAQFGISVENMNKLVGASNSVGLELDTALQIFSSKLQEARDFQGGDTTKSDYLSAYIGKDIGRAFFEFITTAGGLPAEARLAFIGKVFSDKMQNKLAELAQQNLALRFKQVQSKYGSKKEAKAINILAQREDEQKILEQRRLNEETVRKSKVITKGTIQTEDAVLRAKMNREVQNLSQFEIYARQAALQEELLKSVDAMRARLMDTLFPAMQKAVEILGFVLEKLISVIEWLAKVVAAVKKIRFWGG